MIALKPIEALPEPTPEEHLAAELRWLRLLLRRLVSPGAGSSRADAALGPDDLGAFIEGPKAKHPMDAAIEQAGSAVEAMLDRDPGLPFASLSSRVGLRGATRRLLALAYTCASDPWAARAVDLAASEGPGRAADLAFFLRMLAASHEEIDEVLGMLHVTAPLRRHGLVELRGAASGGGWPALRGCELLLPADLVAHLRGVKVGGEAAGIGLKEAARSWGSLHLPLATARQLMALSGTLTGTRLVLWGPDRSGAADVAEALAASQGRHIVSAAHSSAGDELLERAIRQAWLHDAVLHLDLGDEPARLSDLARRLDDVTVPIVLSCSHEPEGGSTLPPHALSLRLDRPGAGARRALWSAALKSASVSEEVCAERLSRAYALSASGIARSVETARAGAERRDPVHPRVTRGDLEQACRRQIVTRLSSLASRVPLGPTWRDLVLESEPRTQLEALLSFARNRADMLERWGFGSTMTSGRGLAALFSGPPGTGKTLAASVISSELGLELYRVDLAAVTSKYIGETEKNLGRIFDEAQDAGVVLLFDEADALFSKRTDARSSTDRYANLEVNYLLQRMEDFDGITVLTTNHVGNLDEAFKRRIRFHVQLPAPDAASREELWRTLCPQQMPLAEDVDWARLALIDFSGGHIRNAVLRAAAVAYAGGRAVTHQDLFDAAATEAQALGKLVRRS